MTKAAVKKTSNKATLGAKIAADTRTKKSVKKAVRVKAAIKPLVSYNINILDISASTEHIAGTLREAVNMVHQTAKDNAKIPTFIGFNTFGGTPLHTVEWAPIGSHAVLPITQEYRLGGASPLFDALKLAIGQLQTRDYSLENPVFKITIITDGQPNSDNYKTAAIQLMKDCIATDKWTFTFQVPKGMKDRFCRENGVAPGNVNEWDTTTEEGTRQMAAEEQRATMDFADSVSKGKTSTTSYYSDLSNVSLSDVKDKLVDVTKEFKKVPVNAEGRIDLYVEDALQQPYIAKTAFYQLTKPEYVQSYKRVLIMKKGSTAVYGGQEARNLIGLGGTEPKIRLKPGNHGDFDVFVESSSLNRLLVRGTKLLIEKKAYNI